MEEPPLPPTPATPPPQVIYVYQQAPSPLPPKPRTGFFTGCLAIFGAVFLIIFIAAIWNAMQEKDRTQNQTEEKSREIGKRILEATDAARREAAARRESEARAQAAESEVETSTALTPEITYDLVQGPWGWSERKLHGWITNRSQWTYRGVTVEFSVFDAGGAEIETPTARAVAIAPGAVWEYAAYVFSETSAKARLAHVKGRVD